MTPYAAFRRRAAGGGGVFGEPHPPPGRRPHGRGRWIPPSARFVWISDVQRPIPFPSIPVHCLEAHRPTKMRRECHYPESQGPQIRIPCSFLPRLTGLGRGPEICGPQASPMIMGGIYPLIKLLLLSFGEEVGDGWAVKLFQACFPQCCCHLPKVACNAPASRSFPKSSFGEQSPATHSVRNIYLHSMFVGFILEMSKRTTHMAVCSFRKGPPHYHLAVFKRVAPLNHQKRGYQP